VPIRVANAPPLKRRRKTMTTIGGTTLRIMERNLRRIQKTLREDVPRFGSAKHLDEPQALLLLTMIPMMVVLTPKHQCPVVVECDSSGRRLR
jgi:hypothetical protein